jgi:uncharacterized protein (DUF697 family)
MTGYESGLEFGEFGESSEFGEFGEFGETGEFGEFGEMGEAGQMHEEVLGSILGSGAQARVGALSQGEEVELATELLEISNEQELEQFLGGLFKKVARGVGGFIKSPIGRALGGVLKSVAKKALPVVGGALGSMVAPGIGTAIGSKLGSMASGLFEVELEAMPQEQAEFEAARRYVNLAASAARHAATARPRPGVDPRTVARAATARAARTYAPGLYRQMMASLAQRNRPASARYPRAVGGRMQAAPGPRAVPQPAGYGAPTEPYDAPATPDDGMFAPEPDGAALDGWPVSGRWVRRGRKIIVLGV